jgi:hypothetical protein
VLRRISFRINHLISVHMERRQTINDEKAQAGTNSYPLWIFKIPKYIILYNIFPFYSLDIYFIFQFIVHIFSLFHMGNALFQQLSKTDALIFRVWKYLFLVCSGCIRLTLCFYSKRDEMGRRKKLKTLCETRWASRSYSLFSFLSAFSVICSSLEELEHGDDAKARVMICMCWL